MVSKKKIIKNNDLLRLIKFRSRNGRKEGCVRLHKVNTLLHETVKMQVMYWCMKNGYQVYSEVEFMEEHGNAGRADVIAIQNGQGYIIEILASEKEEKYMEKTLKYPSEFTMVKVYAKDFKFSEFCL